LTVGSLHSLAGTEAGDKHEDNRQEENENDWPRFLVIHGKKYTFHLTKLKGIMYTREDPPNEQLKYNLFLYEIFREGNPELLGK